MSELLKINLNSAEHTLGGVTIQVLDDNFILRTDKSDKYVVLPTRSGPLYKRGRALTSSDFSLTQSWYGAQYVFTLDVKSIVTDASVTMTFDWSNSPGERKTTSVVWNSASSPGATLSGDQDISVSVPSPSGSYPFHLNSYRIIDVSGYTATPA